MALAALEEHNPNLIDGDINGAVERARSVHRRARTLIDRMDISLQEGEQQWRQ